MGSRSRVFDTMPRDVRDQCTEFMGRPRSNHGFRGCDEDVSRYCKVLVLTLRLRNIQVCLQMFAAKIVVPVRMLII